MSTRTAPDRFLERGDIRLRWRLEGSGPPIALLHGWALDLEYWDPLTTLLAPRFTVLRFDRRGFGLSTGLPGIHSNVDDLAALLAAAAIDRALLVGMSQGARLAIHFALAFPARTRALLLDGAPALEAESDLPLARYRNTLETQGSAVLQADLLLHPLMQLQTPDPASQALLAGCVARYQGLDLLHPARRGRTPGMSAIAAPVLILNGSRDSPARREAGRRLQAAIPGAQRLELPGAGHLAQLDDPLAYAHIVDRFCATLPP
jgi:pimeloyl-ACP methyl ester carboxylesterase